MKNKTSDIKFRLTDKFKKDFEEKCEKEEMGLSQRLRYLMLKDLRGEIN